MKKNIKTKKDIRIAKAIKKKNSNKLIIPAVVILLLAGIVYAVENSQKTVVSQNPIESLKDVRKQIDNEYSKKGIGTNTPSVKNGYIPVLSARKADKLPDYAYTNGMTLQAYKYATEHPEAVEQMPCYCGCAEHGSDASEGKPHKFLRDCFITDKGEYDNHASFCDLCIGINIKTQKAVPQGISG